ncbi:phage antirepressor [Priestia sp. FSL R5-0597]|uniref:phage antirepressor n=1 Tax=Priestia sp. FSL R5-0597 TaxID=2921580 RepID=UPI0030FCA2D1
MDSIQKIFNYGETTVRTIVKNNEPWFVAKDVCEVLEITKYRDAVSRLDEDERESVLMDTLGGEQKMTAINESGLYSLILTSRKPQAKQFKRWVTHEVIPSIRKHGAYMTEAALEQAVANPDFIIGLLTNLKEEKEKNKQLSTTVQKQKPLVDFAEMCMRSETDLLVRELSKLCKNKGLNIGEKRLFQKLRDWGLIFKNKNEPMQRYIDNGLFSVSQGVRESHKGTFTYLTMRITPKGQAYIVNRLIKEVESQKAV